MSNNLITVATLGHIHEADRLKGWLNSAGIESFILDQGMGVDNAAFLEGKVELQVCENDAAKALEIIGSVDITDDEEPGLLDSEIQSIKKILVPIDFSSYSLNAACYAAHVAQQKNATITLVHVYFNPVTNPVSYDHFYSFPANIAETLSEIVENASEMMEAFKGKVNSYLVGNEISVVKLESELIGGIAEEAIIDFAVSGKYDLMIVGVRGKDATENWFGSFMTEIINKVRIPVLAIPADASYKNSIFKRLMYATNFDKSDGIAIRKLIGIAKPLETHISVVHIDDTRDNPFINYDLAHYKEKYVGDIEQTEMDFDLIVNKSRARGIENYIVDKNIDVIAVTSHKRNILTSLFNPSLTKELIFRLKIPMLIFHA